MVEQPLRLRATMQANPVTRMAEDEPRPQGQRTEIRGTSALHNT